MIKMTGAILIVLLVCSIQNVQAQQLDYKGLPQWSPQREDSTNYWLYKGGDTNNKVILPGEKNDTIDITVYTDEEPIWRSISSIEAFTISFDDWGIPHTDASATDLNELVSGHTYSQITVTSGTNSANITITPNTGFIP